MSPLQRSVRMSQEALETSYMEQAGLTPANIDRFVPHQSNVRLFEAVSENNGLASSKTVS